MDLPDFTLLTSFTINQADLLTPITKEVILPNANNGVIAIGTVLNNRDWKITGYLVPSFDFLPNGNRLVGRGVTIWQSTDYKQYQVITFDYPLIGFLLQCKPWVKFLACEVYLGNV